MELQFRNTPLGCLKSVMQSVKCQEQTQEVKLPDAMPDVAKVLGAWGQCVLRGKEWHNGYIGASGGTTVWVLYAPEDGSFPRVVEAWMPWQLQWDLPETKRDGTILVQPQIKSVDARAVSARKLMVRACVEAQAEAFEPIQLEISGPEQLPENIYLQQKKYPVCLPSEAGEKSITIEETLQLPTECEDTEKLVYYNLLPQIQEQKVLGNRVLFRGNAVLKGLCRNPEGRMFSFSFELPLAQYADLERDWGADAAVQVVPAVTNLEVEMPEGGKLQVKAAMAGQYMVCRKAMLEIVADAYSPRNQVKMQIQPLEIPAILEMDRQQIQAVANQNLPVDEILDTAFYVCQPETHRGEDQAQVKLSGVFQLLYRDTEDALQSAAVKWEQTQQLSADASTGLILGMTPWGKPECARTGSGVQCRSDLSLERKAICAEAIPMVSALEVTPVTATGPRPGVILRRTDGETLWDLAKACGSTEAAIREANGLTEEPAPERMLLVPVV